MAGEKATIIKVGVNKNPTAASPYNLQGLPTLIIFKKGQIKWPQSVVVPATHLKQIIELNS